LPRSGSEDRISGLNGGFEWNRTRIDGINRTRAWSGLGIFNHDLVKISLETPLSVTLCSAAI
jgi:IS5 family transposase